MTYYQITINGAQGTRIANIDMAYEIFNELKTDKANYPLVLHRVTVNETSTTQYLLEEVR